VDDEGEGYKDLEADFKCVGGVRLGFGVASSKQLKKLKKSKPTGSELPIS